MAVCEVCHNPIEFRTQPKSGDAYPVHTRGGCEPERLCRFCGLKLYFRGRPPQVFHEQSGWACPGW